MIIREAMPGDATAACEVVRRSIVELCTPDHQGDAVTLDAWLANKTAENLAGWIGSERHIALIAEVDGELAGVALLNRSGVIALLYVAPQARLRGVSKTLLRRMEDEARAINLHALSLDSTATASQFYMSCGYRTAGPPRPGFGKTQCFPMSKQLEFRNTLPEFTTARLTLRPFQLADAADVQRLAGDHSVADTTLTVPHPYLDGMAEEWINSHAPAFAEGSGLTLALADRMSGDLVGAMGLDIRREHDSAELGYWIGAEFRNRGYCTEAGQILLAHGFAQLQLNRVHASHLKRNPASGRVLLKLGMRCEGERRQHVKKWGEYEDLVQYGVLRNEWIGRCA